MPIHDNRHDFRNYERRDPWPWIFAAIAVAGVAFNVWVYMGVFHG